MSSEGNPGDVCQLIPDLCEEMRQPASARQGQGQGLEGHAATFVHDCTNGLHHLGGALGLSVDAEQGVGTKGLA